MRPASLAALVLALSFVARPCSAALGQTERWRGGSPDPNTFFGASVATAGDVNGDGYSDLVVGQYGWSGNEPGEGRVTVFLGGATGLEPDPSWEYVSKSPYAGLGACVAPAGDVNADGYADVLVGAPGYTGSFSNEGRVYLFLGSSSGLGAEPAWTYEGQAVHAQLGSSVSTIGDVDGDEVDDFAIGAPGLGAEGSVLVFLGGASGAFGPGSSPLETLSGVSAGDRFGASVAAAGDVNGDGRGDLIVGAPLEANGALAQAGAAHLYAMAVGAALQPFDVLRGDVADARLGTSVAGVGDLDGDGHADVCAGAPFWVDPAGGPTGQGAVLVAMGGPLAMTSTPLIAGPRVVDVAVGGQFGASVAPAGDVNGDGYGDFVVGAPMNYADGASVSPEGYACVYQGTPSSAFPSHAVFAWSAIGDTSSRFGASVCAAGDCDGDGYGDVVVGSPFHGSSAGRAVVFGGLADLPGMTPVLKRQGNAAICVGDVNGDGYSDLADMIVDGGSSNDFRILAGGPGGVMTQLLRFSPSIVVSGANAMDTAVLGDVNGDGYDDIALSFTSTTDPLLFRCMVMKGTPSLPVVDPASVVESGGYWPIGDVNGDGYADVVRNLPDPNQNEIHLGSPSGIRVTASGKIPNPYYPRFSLPTSVGDTNGDGFGDVVLTFPTFTGTDSLQGRVLLYHGNATGIDTALAGQWTGAHALDRFGSLVNALGDVDGDGRGDFAVAASGEIPAPNMRGSVSIIRGETTVQYLPAVSLGATNGQIGSPVRLGDVNGDGFDDMMCSVSVGPNPARNAVAVYLGSPAGIVTPPAWSTTDRTVMRGWRYINMTDRGTKPADFDGDGFADFTIAGGPDVSHMADSLLTHVFFGNGLLTRANGAARAPQQRRADADAPIALLGLTSPLAWPEIKLAARAGSAAGRTRVRIESDIEDWGTDFTKALDDLVTDRWEPTGAPGAFGSAVALAPARAIRTSGAREKWRLRIASTSPYFPWTKWFSPIGNGPNEFDLRHVAITLSVEPEAPAGLALAPPSPNPSRGATRVTFTNTRATTVDVAVHDAAGRRVATLARGAFAAGSHELRWDGTTASGERASAGVYFVRLQAGGRTSSRRVVLVP